MEAKTLATAARNCLGRHSYPGNVRELANTLSHAALWSTGGQIGEHDIADALLELPPAVATGDDLLNRPIESGVDLPELMRRLASHYLERAMILTGGNKTKAAQSLGLPSYQTLTNWLNRYTSLDR